MRQGMMRRTVASIHGMVAAACRRIVGSGGSGPTVGELFERGGGGMYGASDGLRGDPYGITLDIVVEKKM
jgi:hypothetical protein